MGSPCWPIDRLVIASNYTCLTQVLLTNKDCEGAPQSRRGNSFEHFCEILKIKICWFTRNHRENMKLACFLALFVHLIVVSDASHRNYPGSRIVRAFVDHSIGTTSPHPFVRQISAPSMERKGITPIPTRGSRTF
ncbi:unnamed protein product [Auanema sp. JU1783]|nr:unnamed protein product [Auanema sp. JU1783]